MNEGECLILPTPTVKAELANVEGMENIKTDCCWSFYTNSMEKIVCPTEVIRCHRTKKIMMKHANKRCLAIPRNDNGLSQTVEETYDFMVDRHEIFWRLEKTKLPPKIINMDQLAV